MPIGEQIFKAVRPLVKVIIPTVCGIALSKKGLFPSSASRSAAQIIVKITLPALLFAKIVPAINNENAPLIGIIVLVAAFYYILSAAFGTLLRTLVPTPDNFRYGILAAAIWSNWGDLPLASITSLTASAPFQPGDSDLAIAYISIFIVCHNLTLFAFQGFKIIAADYKPHAKEPVSVKATALSLLDRFSNLRSRSKSAQTCAPIALQSPASLDEKKPTLSDLAYRAVDTPLQGGSAFGSSVVTDSSLRKAGARHTSLGHDTPAMSRVPTLEEREPEEEESMKRVRRPLQSALHVILVILKNALSPPTISLIIALIVALVEPLKALFVSIDGYNGIHPAPDGLPPLAILLETAAFLGAASVPLSLIILGSTLARMRIPRPLSKLPVASIVLLCLYKLVLLPIIGILFVQALVKAGVIEEKRKVLRFVLMYQAVMPTATLQVTLCQVYAPEGVEDNASVLCAYLIPQYAMLLISGSILTVYTLNMLY